MLEPLNRYAGSRRWPVERHREDEVAGEVRPVMAEVSQV